MEGFGFFKNMEEKNTVDGGPYRVITLRMSNRDLWGTQWVKWSSQGAVMMNSHVTLLSHEPSTPPLQGTK